MPHRELPVTDLTISDEDEARYEEGMEACRLHLADLKRAHNKPPAMVQPTSYGRLGPRPVTYTPPSGVSIWDGLADW
jgi:hypothetical protein